MGWFERGSKASAAERVTRADRHQALAALDELAAMGAERDRLMRDGLTGVATIVGIKQDVAMTTVGIWHELILDVQIPGRDPYRASRRIALELSTAPHIAVGSQVPVRVDPDDRSRVLVVTHP
jgi:hypothetical protein